VPDASGDLHGVIDECSQKPGCRELKGNSKPVMSAPAMINKIQITWGQFGYRKLLYVKVVF
jgi:hypothetical protein